MKKYADSSFSPLILTKKQENNLYNPLPNPNRKLAGLLKLVQ